MSEGALRRIDREIAKYPPDQKQSAVMAALAVAQDEKGWLPPEHLKAKLGIGFGETTPDGLMTLKEGECFGACGDAPVLLVNNKRMCSLMAPDKIDALLAELRAAGAGDLR